MTRVQTNKLDSVARRESKRVLTKLRLVDHAVIYHAFTGRLAWLVCDTPRFSDIWE